MTAAAAVGAALLVQGFLVSPAIAEPVTVETAIGERSNHAVEVITAQYDATVKLRGYGWSSAGNALIYTAASKYVRHQLSKAGFISYIFDRAQRDPTKYLKEVGSVRTQKLSAQYVGSGFIATADGYVVTARHVVTADAAVKEHFADTGAAAFAKVDSEALVDAFASYDLSTAAMKHITKTVTAFDRAKVKVTLGAPKIAVRLGVASGNSRKALNQPAEVVYRSDKSLGADVAVLRIRGIEGELPALPLGPASPEQGTDVYVNGFPAAATYLKDFSKAAQLQPTLTKGSITSVKSTTGGLELLQTNANGSGGTSGAATMNAKGEVVGLFVSSAIGEYGAVGEHYLMPLEVIKEALTRSGANLVPSQTSLIWNAALDDFHADRFTDALKKFQQVKAQYSDHPYVNRYIAKSQAGINEGRDKTPVPTVDSPVSLPLIMGGVGLVLLLGIGGLLVVVLRRRPGSPGPGRGGDPVTGWQPDNDPTDGVPRPVPWSAGAGPNAQPLGPAVGAGAVLPDHAGGPYAPASAVVEDPTGHQQVDEADEDAPDAFPGWEPIDYVPSTPAEAKSEAAHG